MKHYLELEITTEVICLFLSLLLCVFCWIMLIAITVWFVASWNLFFHSEDAQSQVMSINIWCLQINSSHFYLKWALLLWCEIYLSRQNTFLNGSLVFWHSLPAAYHFYGPAYSRPVLSHITSSCNSGKVPYARFSSCCNASWINQEILVKNAEMDLAFLIRNDNFEIH